MKKYVRFTMMAFLTAGMLLSSGCPDKTAEDDSINPALVGSWSNQLEGAQRRTFTINSDGSFTATLTPAGLTGEGIVTGILVKEGNDYMMNKMQETTGTGWGGAVGGYNRTIIQITLPDNDTFELKCTAALIVEQFFGGTYYRQ